MLTESEIASYTDSKTFARGKGYFHRGCVRLMPPESDHRYSARVYGTSVYATFVQFNADGHLIRVGCSCPVTMSWGHFCKHVIAVLFAVNQLQAQGEFIGDIATSELTNIDGAGKKGDDTAGLADKVPLRDREDADWLFHNFGGAAPSSAMDQLLYLEPTINYESIAGRDIFYASFRIGNEKKYVIKNLQSFVQDMQHKQPIHFGKQLEVDPQHCHFGDEVSCQLWQLLQECYATECSILSRNLGGRHGIRAVLGIKGLYLDGPARQRFFDIVKESMVPAIIGRYKTPAVTLEQGDPPVNISLKRKSNGQGVLTTDVGRITPLSQDNCVLFADDRIYLARESFARKMTILRNVFLHRESLILPKKKINEFLTKVLPQLNEIAAVDVDEGFQVEYVREPLAAEFYLDYFGDGLSARPSFAYGIEHFNPLLQQAPLTADGKAVIRDETGENYLLSLFAAYGFRQHDGLLVQEDEEKSYDFLNDGLPALDERAVVYYSDLMMDKPLRTVPKVNVGISVNDQNLLEVNFDTSSIDMDELVDILGAYRQKRRYHRLKDGSFMSLGDRQLQGLANFIENSGIERNLAEDKMSAVIPLHQAMYLDALAKEDETLHLERSRRFRQLVREIRNPDDADVEPPISLRHILRDYQVTGFNWLSMLSQYQLGGILADDMGLGKTLQVLAFLLANKDEYKAPALVVAPTSLIYNWQAEAEKFTPELKTLVVAGTKEQREVLEKQIDSSFDLIVTTYSLLRNDLAFFEKQKFSYCFLDEAQHIKNPTTKAAKAVKKLQPAGYFALTGTPIENTLTELWSIFDFLMPGYLFSHQKFKACYETPIVRAQDEQAGKDLERRISPFILRRMKKDVLTELPDKIENQMYCDMTPKQDKLYKAWFLKSQKDVAKELANRNIGESRIKILAILTRLRQLACDPGLFLEDYDGGSGKLDLLEEVVTDAIAGGHRLLIFSQFTTMLGHIASRLEQAGISYYYLDGSTPARERMNLVQSFNHGKRPVFLISLKAGGTGLNLVGADMVVHFDPWWNPAVEDQATDRAYRIGQRNNVQVLKFITKNTIEEKIFALQQRKKALIDQLIKPGESFLSQLTAEEIQDLFR